MPDAVPAPENSFAPASPWWTGLLPWMVYALALKFWPAAAATLALATTVGSAWRIRAGLNPLDFGIIAYFSLLSVLDWSGMGHTLSPRALFALCPLLLGAAAAVSVALRRPFTLAYAYPHAPKHRRDRPAFFFANQLISLLWVAGFAGGAATIFLLPGEWSMARGGMILSTALAASALASVLVGGWFHFHQSGLTT